VNKRYIPEVPKKKSAGEQVKDMAFYLVIMAAVYFVFYFLFLIISWPFRMLLMSDRQRFQAKIDQGKAKILKRTELRKAFEVSDSNPLFQYIERFKLHPLMYLQDPDNDQYEAWFEEMKEGKILDSKLMWAPEIYRASKENGLSMNPSFLDYLSRQLELHTSKGLGSQVLLMKTIRDLYPEFTPKFSVIPSEINNYREEVKSEDLQEELIKTIGGKGISKELAQELVNWAMNTDELKKAVLVSQKCFKNGFCEVMALFCAKFDYDPDDLQAKSVNLILKLLGNESIASAVIHGDIEVDDVTEMIQEAQGQEGDLAENVNTKFGEILRDKCQIQFARG
jgi:hypothetical protein